MNTRLELNITRVKNGYSPHEADAVFEELQRQIVDHKKRINELTNTISQYDQKVSQLAASTKQLEDERIKESLRLTGLMNNAARMAEETEQSARQQAAEIISQAKNDAKLEADNIRRQAQVDYEAARAVLNKLKENAQTIRDDNTRYFTGANIQLEELDKILNQTLSDIPASQAYTPPQEFTPPPMPAIPVPEKFTIQPEQTSTSPYELYAKKLEADGENSQGILPQKRPGKIIGRFDD